MLRYGLGFHVPTLINIANERASIAIIALVLSPANVGLYAVAFSVAGLVGTGARTLAPVSFPKVTSRSTLAEQLSVFGRYVRATLVVTLAVAAMMLLISPWFIPFVFGKAFSATVGVTQILIVGVAASAVRLVFVSGLEAQARLKQIRLAELAGFLTQCVALIILLPSFGITGAAWAYTLSQILPVSIAAGSVANGFRCSPRSLVTPTRADWFFVRRSIHRLLPPHA